MRPTSTAWPFAGGFVALIVYASLYPFEGWRDQGLMPWAFLTAPWPKYWTAFDVSTNVLAYVPLGFCLALGWLRHGGKKRWVWPWAIAASLLSLTLEGLQSYLPMRVASQLDWLANSVGAVLGVMLALGMQRMGWVMRWQSFRADWFMPQSTGAMFLLSLWPVALLFPLAVPFGLGHVQERLEEVLGEWFQGTPFLEWLPFRTIELEPLLPATEVLCMLFGLMTPVLVAFAVVRTPMRRWAVASLIVLLGVLTTSLSAGLTFGAQHALEWLTPTAQLALTLALVLSGFLSLWSPNFSQAALLVLLTVQLMVLNQGASDVYLVHNLQTWQQGQYIRFNGVAQWVGWLWPFVVLVWGLGRLSAKPLRG